MADEQQLWSERGSSILANLDADQPRAEFAAFLDDDQEFRKERRTLTPRAELIYLQLKHARMAPDHAERFRIATRIQSLLIDHKREWIPEVFRVPEIREVSFYRGFISKITVEAAYLARMAPVLLEAAPIEHLDIVAVRGGGDFIDLTLLLAKLGLIQRIRSLGLDSQRIESERTLNLSFWSELRWLSLRNNFFSRESVDELLSRAPSNLRFVDFYGNPGDPSPQFAYDQGSVISTEPPLDGTSSELDRRVWKRAEAGHEVHPSRFIVALG